MSEPSAPRPSDHVAANRAAWDAYAEEYQRLNEPQISAQMASGDIAWGVWGIPESELQVLGDVAGLDVLELGCGAAQWTIALVRRGARPVGLDLSGQQLRHARENRDAAGLRFPLVQASGERVPLADASFDVVFADYGAFHFADPYRTIPESSRLLRLGGLLAFTAIAPLLDLVGEDEHEHATDRLQRDYFGLHRIEEPSGMISFNLPYGEWFRLLRTSGFEVLDLIETRPPAEGTSTYRDATDRAWSRRWPAEILWRARKRA
jgi:SAM-dependent methyltransferase